MALISVAIDAAVVGSAVVALVGVPGLMRSGLMRSGLMRYRPAGQAGTGRFAGPGIALAVVVGLVYVNQVLFTVYVLRVHGADPSFIAQHLPEGWFDLATGNPLIEAIARRFPAPELLAVTVLRVQAFLELPLVLLAYLTVLRWLDRGLYRRVAGSALVWAAAASYTLVFCLVEWNLRNPYTAEDIVIRLVAAVVTPPLIAWSAGKETGAATPMSASGLLLFAVSTWALGYLVLVVYDTALLYNLGHLGERLPGAAIAVAVLAAVRSIVPRLRGRVAPGAGVVTIAAGLRWSLALFFVPALAVRYGVNFATAVVAAAAGAVIVLVTAVQAVREGRPGAGRPGGGQPGGGQPVGERVPRGILAWSVRLAIAAVAALGAAYAAVLWVGDTYYEAALLRAAAVFLIAVICVCALFDRFLPDRCDHRDRRRGTRTRR